LCLSSNKMKMLVVFKTFVMICLIQQAQSLKKPDTMLISAGKETQ